MERGFEVKVGHRVIFLAAVMAFLAASNGSSQQLASQNVTAMVWIEGGTFLMGSPIDEDGRHTDESPQREVKVGSFFMGKCEVTQKEYREIMQANPSFFRGDNLPVERVNWLMAIDYCIRRSEKEGLTPAYMKDERGVIWNRGANGYRLPTEAEWEYACRAGTGTAFNTGRSMQNNTGWYWNNSDGKTHAVGQKPANLWGLYDMHGNVYEWCWDSYDSYARGDRPEDASVEALRVNRGGSWLSSASFVRSARRSGSDPAAWRSNLGFRVVRSGSENSERFIENRLRR